MRICADARRLPFADESLAGAYTRYGFNHMFQYRDALKELYRVLCIVGSLIVAERKTSMWHGKLERVGLGYEDRLKVLRQLGSYTSDDEFAQSLRDIGYDVSRVDSGSYTLFEAVKSLS
jgi:ubiquinone/menaquinone biosynthesis C-methylase UbiE